MTSQTQVREIIDSMQHKKACAIRHQTLQSHVYCRHSLSQRFLLAGIHISALSDNRVLLESRGLCNRSRPGMHAVGVRATQGHIETAPSPVNSFLSATGGPRHIANKARDRVPVPQPSVHALQHACTTLPFRAARSETVCLRKEPPLRYECCAGVSVSFARSMLSTTKTNGYTDPAHHTSSLSSSSSSISGKGNRRTAAIPDSCPSCSPVTCMLLSANQREGTRGENTSGPRG